MVLRIATPHLLAHLGVAVRPERREILGDLERPVGGGEEMDRERHRAVADPGRLGQTEHLLEPLTAKADAA